VSRKTVYRLIDSGDGEKLEQFGDYRIIRPAPQAIWAPQHPEEWKLASAHFVRNGTQGAWKCAHAFPEEWDVSFEGVKMHLKRTEFGHLGIFPEHLSHWTWMQKQLQKCSQPRVLNLFAYSGGSSLACAHAGAKVTHVDSARGMVDWARENADLNDISTIRWMVEDALKFIRREKKRGNQYEGILLDPPTFGRGASGEVFKIEEKLPLLLDICIDLLSDEACFFLLTCHTPGYTPIVLEQLLRERLEGNFHSGEMVLKSTFSLPSGAYAKWEPSC
jgi:23S rRNA (cytosine1962-C5)-methyltransferase